MDIAKINFYQIILYLCLINFGYVLNGKVLKICILHINDIRARFEETDINGKSCEKGNASKCYGGIARVAYIVKKAREDARLNNGPPVLFLHAGGSFSKKHWLLVDSAKIVTDLMNMIGPNVSGLGSAIFSEGSSGISSFIQKSPYPVVTANIVPHGSIPGLKNSTILTVDGHKIGIVGYLTNETTMYPDAQGLTFLDEIETINTESKKLKNQGVKTIIALGYSGYKIDKEIAKKCPLVDLVIGGFSKTLLWNGRLPYSELAEGDYPTVVFRNNKIKVPVVQASKYAKIIGNLTIFIDTESGKLVKFVGKPILLSKDIGQVKELTELLSEYQDIFDELNNETLAITKVMLNKWDRVCRLMECNVGNMVTDALIECRANSYKGKFWTDAPIAFVNGGSIQNSIDPKEKENITRFDVLQTIPYLNNVAMLSIKGDDLLHTLEYSVNSYGKLSRGEFLQYSGVKVVYNNEYIVGRRLVFAKIRCSECEIPAYDYINTDKIYRIIVDDFLAKGGDGYNILKEKGMNKTYLQKQGKDCVIDYLKKMEIIYPEIEGRIIIRDSSKRR